MKRYTDIFTLLLSLLIPMQGWGADLRKGEEAYMIGDYANALREWIPLAERGDLDAQFKLANMYRKGIGVPQDYKTALKWYILSAEQGNTFAQYNIGRLYYLGHGVKEDMIYAHMWANLASLNGFEMSANLRGLIAEQMTQFQIEEAQRLAIDCVA